MTAYGTEGEASLIDPAAGYQLDTLSRPARLHFDGTPTPLRAMNGIEIDFSPASARREPTCPIF